MHLISLLSSSKNILKITKKPGTYIIMNFNAIEGKGLYMVRNRDREETKNVYKAIERERFYKIVLLIIIFLLNVQFIPS